MPEDLPLHAPPVVPDQTEVTPQFRFLKLGEARERIGLTVNSLQIEYIHLLDEIESVQVEMDTALNLSDARKDRLQNDINQRTVYQETLQDRIVINVEALQKVDELLRGCQIQMRLCLMNTRFLDWGTHEGQM